jgi:hypothetical protein
MSKIKYAVAMLAAGGAAGVAASANATTIITATLDLPAGQPNEFITLGALGATVSTSDTFAKSNYVYGVGGDDQTIFESNPFKTDLIGETTTTPGLPSPSESFSTGAYNATDTSGMGPGVTDYVHLFFVTDGTTYLGTAMFDGSGDLESITYEAVPEPEAWALLLAGVGLAGGALRGARKRRQAIAA